MHVGSILIGAVPALAIFTSLTYNPVYSEKKRSLSEVACWDPNVVGLFPNHDDWLVQENVAPGILAIDNITGWDHPDCITCWMVESRETGISAPLLAIDSSESGFVTSLERMNRLTKGRAEELQRIDVMATRVHLANCGFAPPTFPREDSDEL